MNKAIVAWSAAVFSVVVVLVLQRYALGQANPLPPGITRVVITDRHPAFAGRSFGDPGPYEFVSGTAYGELDPKAPLNAAVADLQYAPVDARGRVEYSMDFTILKPVDPVKGNGRLIYDVMNRGHEKALWTLNLSKLDPNCVTSLAAAEPQCLGTEPADVTEPGTAFIMKRGYTVVWSGWQAEHSAGMASRPGLLKANFPIAIKDGKPIVGLSREEFSSVPRGPSFTQLLSYPAATLDQSAATLTVRELVDDPKQPLPASSWSYVNATNVRINAAPGFDGEALYEFIYPATDSVIEGIAYASIRDFVSFLRYADRDSTGQPNPASPASRFTAAFALGSYVLKDFVYRDFNLDGSHRLVFDGVMPLIAGASRLFVNDRFAQPSRLPRQHQDYAYPGDQFPFTYATTHDPISGKTDGLLQRCTRSHSCPKMFDFETDTEIWLSRISLLDTDANGKAVPIPDNVRLFYVAGVPHNSTPLSAAAEAAGGRGICTQLRNQLQYRYYVRALFADFDAWITGDVTPPPSRFPSVNDGSFVTLDAAAALYPSIPGQPFSRVISGVRLTDNSKQPPNTSGPAYPLFVTHTNADGSPDVGIVPPEITVATGSYSGRNYRAKGYAQGDLCGQSGSYIPFAATRAERSASGDSRLSLEERYSGPADFAAKRKAAADQLVQQRLLLPEDAATIEAVPLPVPAAKP
jgi:hypothetical protein